MSSDYRRRSGKNQDWAKKRRIELASIDVSDEFQAGMRSVLHSVELPECAMPVKVQQGKRNRYVPCVLDSCHRGPHKPTRA
jgi:hypothetical protein